MWLNKKVNLLFFVLSFCSLIVYVLVSHFVYRIGYPLDDAWIHQTYARNLVVFGRWIYANNEQSAGSTSLLWTILLALGYLLQIHYLFWTFLIGWISLYFLAIISMKIISFLQSCKGKYDYLVGILIIFEWHLVWAGLSGMETLLFSLIVLIVIFLLITRNNNWFLIGLTVGVSFWIRPDGITLLGPVLFVLIFDDGVFKEKIEKLVKMLAGLLLFILPYFLIMTMMNGSILPNTFFAKQFEYQELKKQVLYIRFINQMKVPLVGAGLILLPGFLITFVQSIINKKWHILGASFWILGYLLLFAMRLPVTYQHGRYVMPVIPVYFVLSFFGVLNFSSRVKNIPWRKLSLFAWTILLTCILFAFWILGARSFSLDVAIIETEMVETAKWISQNLEPDSLIAAHDIGALGYFSNRKILDLAGLITPDVIPFIRDEKKLSLYLELNNVDYLMTFPGWYPELIQNKELIYRSSGKFSKFFGGENMSIYKWGE